MKLNTLWQKLKEVENTETFRAIRRGLMLSFPVILIGCFACVLGSFPVDAYQRFIQSFAGGILKELFDLLNNCCVGCVALWMLFGVSYSFGASVRPDSALFFPVASLCCFLIFVSGSVENAGPLTYFSSKWTFTALLVSLLTCQLFQALLRLFGRRELYLYSSGADNTFLLVLKHIFPLAAVILAAGIAHVGFSLLFAGTDFYNLGSSLLGHLFSRLSGDYVSGLLFLLFVHSFWFFGIHGSNMLENTAQIFEARLGTGAICTKTFLDVFVLMGGCGTSLGLLLALLIAGRDDRNRHLAKYSFLPGLFNINETVIYGLPIFFNRILLIPFLFTPLVTYSIAYAATALGLVPPVSSAVSWQMPVFFSGYQATGSVSGIILQLVNLAVGTLLYLPFIRLMEKNQKKGFSGNIELVVDSLKKAEAEGVQPPLFPSGTVVGDTERGLASDLCHTLENEPEQLALFYQPQMNYDGTVAGAEALLRWKHPIAGYLYPPLVINLAEQIHVADQLSLLLIDRAAAALQEISKKVRYPVKLAVNITASQLKNPEFPDRIAEILKKYTFGSCSFVFELTEQISLTSDHDMNQRLDTLSDLGIQLSLDDFGMGHSSLMYLQDHKFRFVKLDGCLTKNMTTNSASRNIVSSMVEFTKKSGIQLVAEYVETEAQTQALHTLGCNCYQGYYYSKAIPLSELFTFLEVHGALK